MTVHYLSISRKSSAAAFPWCENGPLYETEDITTSNSPELVYSCVPSLTIVCNASSIAYLLPLFLVGSHGSNSNHLIHNCTRQRLEMSDSLLGCILE